MCELVKGEGVDHSDVFISEASLGFIHFLSLGNSGSVIGSSLENGGLQRLG